MDSIIVNPNDAHQVYAGTDWGVYYTDDITVASPTWLRFENGIPHAMVWDMQIDRGSTTLSVWTSSRGAYVYPLPGGASPTPTPTASPADPQALHLQRRLQPRLQQQRRQQQQQQRRLLLPQQQHLVREILPHRGRVLRRRRGHSTQLATTRNLRRGPGEPLPGP